MTDQQHPATSTDLIWVQKASRRQIIKQAQAIYDAFDQATEAYDLKDGEVLRLVLMEVINQLQDGLGLISAPNLFLVAQSITKLEEIND